MKKVLYILILIFYFSFVDSQTAPFNVQLSTLNQNCELGAASIQINGGRNPHYIKWSNGKLMVQSIKDLEAGDYSVVVTDSTVKDTTINFTITKEECKVYISNHFTPNGDNYNDTWGIYNWQYYPEFELYVFNKWGQQVHSQKKTYIPWNGEWLGITAADGTYYYVFYFNGNDKNKFLKGDVSILR